MMNSILKQIYDVMLTYKPLASRPGEFFQYHSSCPSPGWQELKAIKKLYPQWEVTHNLRCGRILYSIKIPLKDFIHDYSNT